MVAAALRVGRVERRGRLRAERREPRAHRGRDAAPGGLAQLRVLAERRRQIAEHRIRVAGDRHQVRRRGQVDDPPGRLAQRIRRDAHVKRRAHVEPHRQAVELGHHDVFEARALELLDGPEHFRADEPGDVVDDGPRAGRRLDVARDAVGARLERHHVDAFGRAVGHRRSLSRLEVAAVEPARQIGDALDVEADHAGQRLRRAGEALEADVHRPALARPRLLDDVREHAVARRQPQPLHDAPQQILELHDRVDLVRSPG